MAKLNTIYIECMKWKTIPGFSRYKVSTEGQLKSMNYKRSGKEKILTPALDGGYYKTVLLNDSGKYKTVRVHKLVLLTFKGASKLETNHKDGNKTNNALSNLEYCNHSYNVKHAFDNGLATALFGEENGNAKLSEEKVKYIRNVAATGGRYYGRKILAEKFRVSECCIKEVVSRRKNLWSQI